MALAYLFLEDVMKRVIQGRVGMGSLALALLLPALAASQQKTENAAAASSHTRLCTSDTMANVPADAVWRLRAYQDLDCALAILDAALNANGGTVTLSRQEAERARASVWSARDAAARIGR